MLEINQMSLNRYDKFSIYTIPAKSKNYGGYKTMIPNKYISKSGFERYINLSDNQKLKFKKEDDITVNPYTEQLWIKSLSKPVDFCNETFKGSGKTRGEALSGLVIELWNDLTDEQRNEVKEILK